MASEESKRKFAVAGLTSILLVAAVIAVSIGSKSGGPTEGDGGAGEEGVDISASTKAVEAICASTTYMETCEESLADANTTDTRQLVEMAINYTVSTVAGVLKNSSLLDKAASDPATKEAFKVCEDVLDRAAADLRRTVEKIAEFDFLKTDEFVADLRTWLSAVVTNQVTCVDAFENTTGDTGERMRELLRTTTELSSNGLAMIASLSAALSSFNFGSLFGGGGSRRLLSAAEEEALVNRRLSEVKTLSRKPDIVVAPDGTGQFKTINEAVAAVKSGGENFTVIQVKGGVYREYVSIPKGKNKVVMIGDGHNITRIVGNKSLAGGVPTFYTATVDVNSEEFLAKDIGIENDAGPEGHQATALRVSGDRAIFYNVSVTGYQGSLNADSYRQFYRNCTITGSIDSLFGDALALFQDCRFVARKPGPNHDCTVVAQGRNDSNSNSAFVIQNSQITAEPELIQAQPPVRSYLGRPWKPYSRTIIMQTAIEGFIDPAGWSEWTIQVGLDTCYFGEYENTGPGSDVKNRVKWPGIRKVTPDVAKTWTGSTMYGGDGWITESGVEYDPNLKEA